MGELQPDTDGACAGAVQFHESSLRLHGPTAVACTGPARRRFVLGDQEADDVLPASFMKSIHFERRTQEFGEFVRPGRITVR